MHASAALIEVSTLVGRAPELAALAEAVAGARAGHGAVLLVAGEPGIGKTALARAFTELASASGLAVAWGRAWEAGGAPPYWLWIEAARAVVEARPDAGSPRAPGLAVLSGLVPELGGEAGVASEVVDPATLRFRIGDALAALLRRAARAAPLAIVLDDLHAADRPSLEVLRFVAGRLRDAPIVLLGTYREAEARLDADVAEVLAKVARDARTLRLGPIDRPAIGELVRRAGLADEVADAIGARTEGNPLFVVETLRLWRTLGGRAVPDTIRDVVERRLDLLPAATRRLLEVGAAMGRELDVPWLSLAAGLGESAAREALRPAFAADVLAERDAARATFTHVLIRDALYRALPEARRVALHLALAEALERRQALDARARVMGLAHHYLEAAELAGLERALLHARAAAERAIELDAHEEAVALLERALSVIDLAAPGPAAEGHRAEVLIALGLAAMRAGEPERGKAACLEAAAIARAAGDAAMLARAALALGTHLTFAFVDPDLVRLLEEALHALGPDASATRARLLARLAAALQPHDDPLHPMALAREAVALSRGGDDATRLEVLTAAGSALAYFAEPAERAALSREMLAVAVGQGDEVRRARALLRLVFDHLEAGDAAASDEAAREHARVAARLRLPVFTWVVPLVRTARAITDGRFADGLAALAEAEATPGRPSGVAAELTLSSLRVGLARAAGRIDGAAERALVALCGQIADPWYPLAFAAGSAALQGDAAALSRALVEIGPRLEAWRHRLSLGWLAEAAVAAKDRALAERLYPMLAPLAHRCHLWGVAMMVVEGPLTEPLGRLAAMLGRDDEAVACLERALATATAMGARPFMARGARRLAEALAVRGRPEDLARARELRAEADALAAAMGLDTAASSSPGVAASSGLAPARAQGRPVLALDPGPAFSIVREGELWTVSHGGKHTRLKDSRGLQLLAQLVEAPGREMHVLELLGAGDAADAGEALDAQAIRAYRRRVEELREDLDEARARNDLGRVDRLQGELDAVARELAAGVGLGGKARREGSSAERARVNVRRRLVLAIERIAVDLPALGRHLMRAVRTGTVCVYRPDE